MPYALIYIIRHYIVHKMSYETVAIGSSYGTLLQLVLTPVAVGSHSCCSWFLIQDGLWE